jgi:hypothetical protein
MDGQMIGVAVSPESFCPAMRQENETMLREVMEAVNKAPDGAWINGSEMQVRDLLGEYRRRVFEKALQMKVDASEGAFSPNGPGDGQAAEKQGSWRPQRVDQQRAGERAAPATAVPGRRRADAG